MFKPASTCADRDLRQRVSHLLAVGKHGCWWPCERQLIAASVCQSNPGMMFSATNKRALGVPLTDRQQQLKAIRCSRSRAPAPRVAAVAERSEGSRKRFLDLSRQKLVPARLLSCTHGSTEAERPQTVYTARFTTGRGRGAGIEEPAAGVFVCLIGRDGASFLHRVGPLYDAEDAEANLRAICEVADKEAGANCPTALRSAALAALGQLPPKPRFQPNSVDEVCFLGPELGPLAGLLVGPQMGSWLLEEAHISSSRTRHTDRFVCREELGGSRQPAGYLTPVPENSVVYGSGSSSVILTKEQASALHAMGMLDYGALKSRLTIATAALVAIGTATFAVTGGWETAAPFAVGGTAGLLYQLLMQRSVDAIPGGSGGYSAGGDSRFMQAMGSGYARFTFVVVATLLTIHALDLQMTPDADPAHSAATTAKFFTGAAGFLMWKVAVLTVTAMPSLGSSPPPRSDSRMQPDRR